LNGEIEFRNVSFEYEPGQSVLSTVNLTVRPGEKIAVVGATGSGKSTLVSLIPRLYDVTEGKVLINGIDIRNYKLQSLREQISMVLQDSLLFTGTIAENIAFGRPGATQEQIEIAAQKANAEEFITRLPEGYDTPVTERGSTLSGGQKQRIAIARAILRDAPILILDEPTSGLDIAAERVVLEALLNASEGRTTIIISHRLMSLEFVDRIAELNNGHLTVKDAPGKDLRA
jgi:ABC-type multidrug transport system fused ATPase/permease subunit